MLMCLTEGWQPSPAMQAHGHAASSPVSSEMHICIEAALTPAAASVYKPSQLAAADTAF